MPGRVEPGGGVQDLGPATVGEGRRLGPVGATIVAEVVAAILAADPASFLGAVPPWAPFLGPRPGECTLADLVAYATG